MYLRPNEGHRKLTKGPEYGEFGRFAGGVLDSDRRLGQGCDGLGRDANLAGHTRVSCKNRQLASKRRPRWGGQG